MYQGIIDWRRTMQRTLILYNSDKMEHDLLELLHKALGPAFAQELNKFHGNFEENLCFALFIDPTTSNINEEVLLFFHRYKNQLTNCRIGITYFVTCGNKCHEEMERRIALMFNELSNQLGDYKIFFDNIYYSNDHKEDVAAKLRVLKRYFMDTANMPQELLMNEITRILKSHNTCTLCTGSGNSLRATPIEYTYYNGSLYFLSEGGEKFINLSINTKVAAAVYKEYDGFDKLEGVQMEGTATMVKVFSEEYNEIIASRGLSLEHLKSLPVSLNMFRVIPDRIEVLCSQFKKDGYLAKQVFHRIGKEEY